MFDLSAVLEGMLGRFEEVTLMRRHLSRAPDKTSSGGGNDDGLLGKLVPQLRQHKEAFERRRDEIRRRTALPLQTMNMQSVAQQQPQIMEPMISETVLDTYVHNNPFDMSQVDFSQLDDVFWQDFMGDYGPIPQENL
jgi:hypothetical protein